MILERGAGPESGRLTPTEVVTMLLEVVCKTSLDRDYRVKRNICAAGKVPAYLVIDPIMAQCVLLTEPTGSGEEADYAVQRISKFGGPMSLHLLGMELDTSEFQTLPGARPHSRP